MDINKKTRTELKQYFKANDKPTEKQFSDFIDAGINQAEDSIVKEQGSPLAIQAEGDEVGTQELLDLYTSFGKNSPNWSLNLNPRVKSEDPNSNQSGLNIKDATGQSRLFIKSGDGNIGVGTIDPESKLTIHGEDNTSSLAVIDTTKQNAKIFEVTQKDGDGVLSLRGGDTEEAIHLSGSKEKPSFFLGKVGIGTSSPDANLHVFGENATLKVTNTKKNGKASLVLSHHPATNKQWEIAVPDENGSLQFKDGNTNTVTLKSGRLGIGGVNPAAPLSISGEGKETGPDGSIHITKHTILFGGNNAGKHNDSAQISAGKHKENSLNIVGMSSGTSSDDRKVDIWAEGGMTVRGHIKTPINQVVAFSVSLSADMGGAKNPLTFGQVNYNLGNHLKDNWYFVAPVKGLYVFTMCLRSTTDSGTIWNLRLNGSGYINGSGTGEVSERSMISTTKKFHSSSRSITTLLEVGDKVHVHQTKGGADNYSSGFEGMLLQVLV